MFAKQRMKVCLPSVYIDKMRASVCTEVFHWLLVKQEPIMFRNI